MTLLYRRLCNPALIIAGAGIMALVLSFPHPAAAVPFYQQTNLVSDGFVDARFTDPNLINPWGLAVSPAGPFWVANQGSGTSTLYNGNGERFPVGSPLVVDIPSSGGPAAGPTGVVFNSTADFLLPNGSNGLFFFANLDGSIAGWNPAARTNAVRVVAPSGAAVYTGLAIGSVASDNFLYAANGLGQIDVFDANYQPTTLAGDFSDPNLPPGLVPFNIQNIGGQIYVTYAPPGPEADESEPGTGVVNVFDTQGNLIRRLITGGPLASPWGLALAPADFGPFSSALLVGNFNDEHGNINAFNSLTGAFLGTLADASGNLFSEPDLWGLVFGNGAIGGRTNELFFTAGIGDEEHGLFGKLQAVPEPDTLALSGAGLALALIPLRHRRGVPRGPKAER